MSLGGILMCITRSEEIFADLGHFSQLSIKIVYTFVVYPALILAYMGQATYPSQHHEMASTYWIGFYVSVPEKLRWPVLGITIIATVVGSILRRKDIKKMKNNPLRWKKIQYPRQNPNSTDCGYYICRFIIETIANRRPIIPDER